MFEHELEQMRIALADLLEIGLNGRDVGAFADRLYGEGVATSLEQGTRSISPTIATSPHRGGFASSVR
ncbi:MAG: hypothetical protein IPQ15_16710 [Betaproteobacteria bacterium]|nr:hypothetical protein [Betaproteobacteria bacterium]